MIGLRSFVPRSFGEDSRVKALLFLWVLACFGLAQEPVAPPVAPPVVQEPEVEPSPGQPAGPEIPNPSGATVEVRVLPEAPITTPPAAVSFPTYAYITGTRVRLRGGPSDGHAILRDLRKGSAVRLLGQEGAWFKAQVPGGVDAFVSLGEGGKSYLSSSEPGVAVVAVTNLQVRGDASKNFPPLGKLQPGDRVQVLDTKNGFARITSPEAMGAYVYSGYVEMAADQAKAAADFDSEISRQTEEQNRLKAQAAARALAAETERASRERIQTVFSRYQTEAGKPLAQRDLTGLAEVIASAKAEAAANSPEASRLEVLSTSVQDWTRARSELERASARVAEVRREAEEAQTQYRRELEQILIRKQNAQPSAEKPGPYITTGWVRRSVVPGFPEAPNVTAPFALYQARDTRKFILESDRYNLADFVDKLVGVVAAAPPEDRPGQAFRVLKIEKIEIIDQR